MTLFLDGIALGVLLTVPLAVLLAMWVNRRTRARVERLAQRTRGAERLAELGKLTGGLAHEIKNPLSSVVLNIQLIQEDLRDLASAASIGPTADSSLAFGNGDREDRLGRIQRRVDALTREIQRLRNILEDFLRFAGRVRLELAPTDLGALIRELTDFFSPQALEAKVRIRTQLPEQPAILAADAGLLKQALLNLMINATQAIVEARQSGKPTGGAPDGEELILKVAHARTAGHEEYRIHVIDTGPGIAPDQMGSIFQPYFSTKKTGTGLGLPTARRIIEEHGGSITVHSEVGRGSDFLIAMPIAPAAKDVLDKAAVTS